MIFIRIICGQVVRDCHCKAKIDIAFDSDKGNVFKTYDVQGLSKSKKLTLLKIKYENLMKRLDRKSNQICGLSPKRVHFFQRIVQHQKIQIFKICVNTSISFIKFQLFFAFWGEFLTTWTYSSSPFVFLITKHLLF